MKHIQLLSLIVAFIAPDGVIADSAIDPEAAFAWGGNVGEFNWRPSLAEGVLTGEYVFVWARSGPGTQAGSISQRHAAFALLTRWLHSCGFSVRGMFLGTAVSAGLKYNAP